jgi:hypothetical protein
LRGPLGTGKVRSVRAASRTTNGFKGLPNPRRIGVRGAISLPRTLFNHACAPLFLAVSSTGTRNKARFRDSCKYDYISTP